MRIVIFDDAEIEIAHFDSDGEATFPADKGKLAPIIKALTDALRRLLGIKKMDSEV